MRRIRRNGRDGEIKAAPSVGRQVVGFVEQFATALKATVRRSSKIFVFFQFSWRRRLLE
jgi:hypothetical protein